jgi:hypothetical protein
VFDGVHRLGLGGGDRHGHPIRPSPAGRGGSGGSPTRLLARDGPALGLRAGSELVPAFLLGALALVAGAVARGARGAGRATRRGLALALAVWLLTGFVAFSAVGRLQARYLEAFTPAIAASLGIGLVVAIRAAVRRREARAALAAAVAASGAYALYLSSGTPGLGLLEAGLALAAVGAVLLLARWRGRGGPAAGWAPAIAGVLCLAALLVVPASETIAVVRHHATAASTGSRIPPRELAALDRYLRAHQGRARYEVATLNPYQAAPLIARAGRPVVVLFNVNRRPLLSDAALHRLARSGQVRYVFLGSACGRASPMPRSSSRPAGRSAGYLSSHQCVSTADWLRAHASPVRIDGRYGGIYRLSSAIRR